MHSGRRHPRVVYRFLAGIARMVTIDVVHTPNTDTPIGYAHADIVKPEGFNRAQMRDVRQHVYRGMTLVDGFEITLDRNAG